MGYWDVPIQFFQMTKPLLLSNTNTINSINIIIIIINRIIIIITIIIIIFG
jgi:hypothetical protein